MSALPAGTVTFLFSDIEGSTTLLQQLGDAWGDVLGEQRRLLRGAVADAGGREVDNQGDAFFFVFARAREATAAAAEGQRALRHHGWPDDVKLRVRMGLHTGEPTVGDEGYLGIDVVRAARICSAAHGCQVLVSEATRALVGGDGFLDLGEHRLKDIEREQRLFQLEIEGLPSAFPPLRTLDEGAQAPALPFDLERLKADYAKHWHGMAERIIADVHANLADELQGVPGLSGAPPTIPPPKTKSRWRRLRRRGDG